MLLLQFVIKDGLAHNLLELDGFAVLAQSVSTLFRLLI